MTLDQRLHTLHNCEFFGGVPESDLLALAEVMHEEHFASGERVCSAGDVGDRVYLVMTGGLDVAVPGQGGSVRQLGPGDLFGEYGMFDGGLRTATVTCREDTSLLTLDYARFRAFLLDFPETMLSIFGTTVHRLLHLERQAVAE